MYKVNQEFIDYVCGKGNSVNADKLTAKITREYGNSVEVQFNESIPAIGRESKTFGIDKKDFKKWFVKI